MEVNGFFLFFQGIEFPWLSFSKTDVQISENSDHCLLYSETANDLLLQQKGTIPGCGPGLFGTLQTMEFRELGHDQFFKRETVFSHCLHV